MSSNAAFIPIPEFEFLFQPELAVEVGIEMAEVRAVVEMSITLDILVIEDK